MKDALTTIITDLENLEKGVAKEKPALVETINRLSALKNNPIKALVSLSSTFNADDLANVLTKLKEIKTAVEQSLFEDAADEDLRKTNYEKLDKEYTDTINTLGS